MGVLTNTPSDLNPTASATATTDSHAPQASADRGGRRSHRGRDVLRVLPGAPRSGPCCDLENDPDPRRTAAKYSNDYSSRLLPSRSSAALVVAKGTPGAIVDPCLWFVDHLRRRRLHPHCDYHGTEGVSPCDTTTGASDRSSGRGCAACRRACAACRCRYVRADPASAAPPGAPVHLLVPPMTGSASMWIDLVPHLRQLGAVVSVDLRDDCRPHRCSVSTRATAGPRRALRVGLPPTAPPREPGSAARLVDGWPGGGAGRGAHAQQDSGSRLGGAGAAVASDIASRGARWQTLGRLVVASGPPTTRMVLRLAGRRILDAKRTAIKDAGRSQVAVPTSSVETRAASHERRSTCGSMASMRPAITRNGSRARPRRSRQSPKPCSSRRGRRTRHSMRCGAVLVLWEKTITSSTPVAPAARPTAGLDTPTHR